MPIKEFECNRTPDCRTFEKRFATYPEYKKAFLRNGVLCPVCGGIPKETVSQTARPQFKGSGFYENDYK